MAARLTKGRRSKTPGPGPRRARSAQNPALRGVKSVSGSPFILAESSVSRPARPPPRDCGEAAMRRSPSRAACPRRGRRAQRPVMQTGPKGRAIRGGRRSSLQPGVAGCRARERNSTLRSHGARGCVEREIGDEVGVSCSRLAQSCRWLITCKRRRQDRIFFGGPAVRLPGGRGPRATSKQKRPTGHGRRDCNSASASRQSGVAQTSSRPCEKRRRRGDRGGVLAREPRGSASAVMERFGLRMADSTQRSSRGASKACRAS